MKKLLVFIIILVVGFTVSWYLDIWHKPVEQIEELIGQNYHDAHKIYFHIDPDKHYKLNINSDLNEFDGGILNKKEILTDSIIHVYTWNYTTHKKTIWVGKTKKMKTQIIDAMRISNDVEF